MIFFWTKVVALDVALKGADTTRPALPPTLPATFAAFPALELRILFFRRFFASWNFFIRSEICCTCLVRFTLSPAAFIAFFGASIIAFACWSTRFTASGATILATL